MPLPKAGDKQTTERLEALYDEYCKIALKEILRGYYSDTNANIPDVDQFAAMASHKIATAMLNERNKK